MTDYRFRWDAFDCPFCAKTIARPHVKRHVTTHSDVPKEDADVAWIRWLEAQEEVSAENADRMVAMARRRTFGACRDGTCGECQDCEQAHEARMQAMEP